MTYEIDEHRLRSGQTGVEFMPSPNIGGTLRPKLLAIHYTASGPASDIAGYFAKPSARVSAHLVIRRDGTVVQCVPFNVVAWHAGKSAWISRSGQRYSGLNNHAIGIELENWGPLCPSGSGWMSWTGVAVEPGKLLQARHKFGAPDCGWELFPEPQVEATIQAAQAICREYGIEEIVGHDDIAPGRKSDPGPAWNMGSFTARVFGRSEDDDAVFVVRSPTGLNIRSGPGPAYGHIRPQPLASGTLLVMHQAQGHWRYVSVLNRAGNPDFSGWVHGAFIREA